MVKTPINLAEASVEEKKEFLSSFDTVIFDCDGVLWTLLNEPIKGSNLGVKSLHDSEKEIFFVSNNATRSVADLEKKFACYDMDFNLERQFITPADAIVDYLKRINFQKKVFLIGSENLAGRLKECNFDVITGPDSIAESTYFKELMTVTPNVGAVVFDSDLNLNLIKIHKAEIHLLNPECLLIFGATEDEYDLGTMVLSMAGKIQKCLHDKFDRKPIVLGKPGKEMAEYISRRFSDQKVLFVGDNLETDMGFANKLGFKSLLVFSGCSSEEDLRKHEKEDELPDYYLKNVGELADVLREIK